MKELPLKHTVWEFTCWIPYCTLTTQPSCYVQFRLSNKSFVIDQENGMRMQGLSHIVDCYLDFCHSCFNPLLTLFTFIKTGHLQFIYRSQTKSNCGKNSRLQLAATFCPFHILMSYVTYVNNSLHLVRKYARTLSVPRNEQFSERKAQGKL